MFKDRRVVLTLVVCQALFQTGGVLMATVGGLAGLQLAPDPALATLPIAMVPLGAACATIPASLIMNRIGRRRGFVTGALIGAVGGFMATASVFLESFLLLCLGTFLIGMYQGCSQFYRFAAAEAAPPHQKAKALSLVLTGGVIAAVAGPYLGAWTQDALTVAYAGSFLVLPVLSLTAAAILASTPFPPMHEKGVVSAPPRPLIDIVRQPRFIAAVGSAGIAFWIMSLAMTATPISMAGHHHPVSAAAAVIQWHVLGMYVPSFFSGWLIRKLGVARLMFLGVMLLSLHVVIASTGWAFLSYVSALTALGVGWNFLYVGGSTLLTETYTPSERGKAQAANDFTVIGVSASAAFSAGALHDLLGWRGLNFSFIPLLIFIGLAILAVSYRARRPAQASPA
jgi:MFS family permease